MLRILFAGLKAWAEKGHGFKTRLMGLSRIVDDAVRADRIPVLKKMEPRIPDGRMAIAAFYGPEDFYDRQGDMALLSRKMAIL